jgi:Leucine-rich repeat (LRR) protein
MNLGEKIPVDCFFFIDQIDDYSCAFMGVTIENNVSLNFIIGGDHYPDKSNDDVTYLKIEDSTIPFIFKEIFETFPNIAEMSVNRGGLVTFQKNAFFKAENLRSLWIINNHLTVLYPHAFVGATNLRFLILNSNRIKSIDEHALVGLNSLGHLQLRDNEIEELPKNLFRPAIRFRSFYANRNNFTRINGDMFARKYQIYQIDFPLNEIDAIERSFMDNLNTINQINLLGNKCVNRFFILGTTVTFETMREALEPCFVNYEKLQVM